MTFDTNATENPKIRVAVVYGGRSSEHSISCISAGAVMAHLDRERYEVVPVGITESGVWTVGEDDPEKLRAHGDQLPSVQLRDELALSLNPNREGEITNVSAGRTHAIVDVVFPVLHGPYGEDGTIQGLFELAGVNYVGPGVLSSSAGMDKEYTKKLAAAEGLPITPEKVLRADESLSALDREHLGLPVFVKPARGGSSIGITKVTDAADLDDAIATARRFDDKVIVEAMVHGAEVEVGVLEYPDGRIEASLPAQLNGTEDSDEGFYGFEAKYLDDVVTPSIPAEVGEETIAELQRLAIKTFHALDCKGLARVDFFVTDEGPVLNEINTMPGFTPISMYPQMFAASGVDYETLLDTLINSALRPRG
ncbi:D-alanine--D-alanine ligase family protein [Corynebacterium yudongzhengii]|uniref:D-alanine--D-alanine ligase family protein n=1 Tax=Corynebacterium yudongzhengii TaxID=2080740 RepID=UPI001F3DE47D|nr:D-alanine--D-alanine ligase family protein [Corynebacterium yudongzhengii]